VSFLHYNFCFMPRRLHCPLLCFCICLHLFGLLYSTCISRDRCSSTSIMFSSLVSFSIVCSSTKCCSTPSSSSDSSMNTGSIDVALSRIYSFGHQHLLLLWKNSTIDVLVVFISWIIVYANCVFSLYAFLFTHSNHDNECGGKLKANGWIFNTPSLSSILNSFSTFVLLNNFASSSCFCLCSFLYVSFSLVIFCNFSIAFFIVMLLWTTKFRKCAQPLATNTTCFRQYPFFGLKHPTHRIHFFIGLSSFNEHMILKINMTHHYKFVSLV